MTGTLGRSLHVNSSGSGSSLIFLHGFTQTSRSWATITSRFAASHECSSVDLPGHGLSRDGRRTLNETAADVVASTRPGTVIGYSFGARVALHIALRFPQHVTRLVLVSGTAGIIDDDERARRKTSDDALADRIERIGVDAFIDEWLALPLFAGLTTETDQRMDRCTNTASGLADSLRYAGAGTQRPLWNELGNISCDTLLVAGGADSKFVGIAELMHQSIPHSELQIVQGAGHTVHLEAPDQFLRVLNAWLTAHPDATA